MDSDEEESINGRQWRKGSVCTSSTRESGGASMKRPSTRPHYCLLEHTPEWEGGKVKAVFKPCWPIWLLIFWARRWTGDTFVRHNWWCLCCALKCAIITWKRQIRDVIDWGRGRGEGRSGAPATITIPGAFVFWWRVWHRQIKSPSHLENVKRPLSSTESLWPSVRQWVWKEKKAGARWRHMGTKHRSWEWSRGKGKKNKTKNGGFGVRVEPVEKVPVQRLWERPSERWQWKAPKKESGDHKHGLKGDRRLENRRETTKKKKKRKIKQPLKRQTERVKNNSGSECVCLSVGRSGREKSGSMCGRYVHYVWRRRKSLNSSHIIRDWLLSSQRERSICVLGSLQTVCLGP